MIQDLLAFLSAHGLAAVFLVTFAARVGVPVPAAPLLVVAGALGSSGQMSLSLVTLVSLLANLAGDTVWFAAGRLWGHRVLRVVCRVSLSADSCVRQSEELILRWGGSSLVAAKFVPGVSAVAAPMAGALGMAWLRFIVFGLLSGAFWTLLFLAIGVVFAAHVERVLDVLAGAGLLGGAVLAAALVAFLAYRWHRRRASRAALDVPRIEVAELRALLDAGRAPVIVDVRSAPSMQVDPRRIPQALHVVLADMESFARTLPRDREVVFYCACPNEASAAQAAVLVRRAGGRARPLAGGLDAWYAESPRTLAVAVPPSVS